MLKIIKLSFKLGQKVVDLSEDYKIVK